MKKENPEGRLALVTGASSGIGLCFARELARRGCRLVMVSNQDTIHDCAARISEEFNVDTFPFFCDLTAKDAVGNICAFIDAEGLEPDYLINNAGIFSFSPVTETPQRKIDCFIDLHIRAVTGLSREFAGRFMKRGRGRILNMSSMSCWMPMPGIALYSATKAYIRVFSRALHYETRDSGVTVTAACPGGIATDLFGLPANLMKLAVAIRAVQTPEKFTNRALDRMLRGKRQYINGIINRIAIPAVALTPTWLRIQIKRRMLDAGIRR